MNTETLIARLAAFHHGDAAEIEDGVFLNVLNKTNVKGNPEFFTAHPLGVLVRYTRVKGDVTLVSVVDTHTGMCHQF